LTRLVCIADVVGGVFLQMSAILASLAPEADDLEWSILDNCRGSRTTRLRSSTDYSSGASKARRDHGDMTPIPRS
jgi:hypothetical protein